MVYYNVATNISPSGNTGWQTVDLSSIVPVGTSFVIVHATTSPSSDILGIRIPNSSDGYRTMGGGSSPQIQVVHQLGSSRQIDLYKNHATTQYYLRGYFTADAIQVSPYIDKTPSVANSWQDIDLSNNIPTGIKWAIFQISLPDPAFNKGLHFRAKGSTQDRWQTYSMGYFTAIVPIDANRVCQCKSETTSSNSVLLTGYIIGGQTKTNAVDISLSTLNSYQNIDLSFDNPPSDAIAALVEIVDNQYHFFGIRQDGSSEDIRGDCANTNGIYIVPLTSNIFEAVITTTSTDFWLWGYLTNVFPPTCDFSGTPVLGNSPLAVDFTDLSTGTPTYWEWDFGDGTASIAWTERQPGGNSNQYWQGVASDDDGSNLIAGVFNGRLYTSSDSGVNWTERQPGGNSNQYWQGVASDDDGSNLIAGCGIGRLYTSSNGGINWTERQPAGDFDKYWISVSSDSDGSNLIVGDGLGRLYTSSNGGINWTERQPAGNVNRPWFSVASDSDGSNLIACTYYSVDEPYGRIYTSSNGGINWTERRPAGDFDKRWVSVASDDDGSNLIAGVFNGRLYTSSDSGVNWTERQPAGNIDKYWSSVASDSDGSNLIANVWGGRLYTSSNVGVDWIERQPGGNIDKYWLSAASDSDGSNLIVGGQGTCKLYTASNSCIQNPTHTYQNDGIYTVKLTVSNVFGFDSEIKTNYITVCNVGTISFTLPPIQTLAESWGISVTLPPLQVAINGFWANYAKMILPPLRVQAYGESKYDDIVFNLPPIIVSATGIIGKSGDINIIFPPITVKATSPDIGEIRGLMDIKAPITVSPISMFGFSHNYGRININTPVSLFFMGTGGNIFIDMLMPTIGMLGYVLNRGNIDLIVPIPKINIGTYLQIIGNLDMEIPLSSVFMEGLTVNSGIFGLNVPMSLVNISGLISNLGSLSITIPISDLNINAIITIMGSLNITVPFPYITFLGIIGEALKYIELIINSENLALSEYANYEYDNLDYFNGKYIGIKSDGIYELEGETDQGIPIKALIRFPTIDLYKDFKTRLNELFYTGRNFGTLQVKTIEDEREIYNYLTKITNSRVHEERMKLGRGHTGRFLILEFSNPDGRKFDINNIRVLADKVGARLR